MAERYRPAIPLAIKLICIIRDLLDGAEIEFDHCPPLALREYDEATRTYSPPANDPTKIVARLKPDHRAKTHHPRGPHTTIGSDQHLINKAKPDRAEKFAVLKPTLGRPTVVDVGERCRRCGEYGEDCTCPPREERSSFRRRA